MEIVNAATGIPLQFERSPVDPILGRPFLLLGATVVAQAAKDRDARADSDLDDAQPVVVTVSTTLGELRECGLRRCPSYQPKD